jgi:hypothetical protein
MLPGGVRERLARKFYVPRYETVLKRMMPQTS